MNYPVIACADCGAKGVLGDSGVTGNPLGIHPDDPNKLEIDAEGLVVLQDSEYGNNEPTCDDCEAAREDGPPERDEGEDLIDGVGFADPSGVSALRAATPGNPRNLPCPTCGGANRLTPADVAAGYQCDRCADQAERGY